MYRKHRFTLLEKLPIEKIGYYAMQGTDLKKLIFPTP